MPNRTDALNQTMRTFLTPERLSSYTAAAGGDLARALDLYEWNARLSAAVFEDLGYLEVILRNACHAQLEQWNRRSSRQNPWYLASILTPESHRDVAEARRRATRGNRTELPGRVVAELMFGFWRFLHARSYEATLWTPCLRLAYPHQRPNRRQDVYRRLDHLNTLRNRIAHHEPIHSAQVASTGKDIAGLYRELLELLSWIDPSIASWVRAHSAVPALLGSRPF